jgi:hypothetical protein
MGMNKPDAFNGWTEPESAANTDYQPVYPYNNVTQTRSGHMFELDDTKGRERVRLQHRANTFIEMHPNGDEVHKVFGDGYVITLGDHNISIGVDDGNKAKKLNITVYGDVNMYVTGDKTETIDGSVMQHIKGNYTQVVEGVSNITSQNDMTISAGSGISGSLNIKAGSSLSLDSDLRVRGEIMADKIFSFGRIDTGPTGGISAGKDGFVSLFGGLAIGFPMSVVGNIICVGTLNAGLMVNAGVSMNSPVATFGLMTAGLMTDTVNTSIYNSHIHPTPEGPSGPTTSPMI